MGKLPNIEIPIIQNIPILGGIFGEQNLLTYFAFVMVILTALLLYKTPFGVAACAIGELPECVESGGIKPNKVALFAILWSGMLCGIAGTYLSTVSVSGFTEDMVQGRGFTAFSALIFGNGNPFITWAVSIHFGFADALGIRVEPVSYTHLALLWVEPRAAVSWKTSCWIVTMKSSTAEEVF